MLSLRKCALYAVLLNLVLPDIADFPLFGSDAVVGTTLQDFMADPGVQDVYQECSHRKWVIVARLGSIRQNAPLSSQVILYLFVKSNTVGIQSEYFRTPQGRYVLLTYFPAGVVDKALLDFIKK